MNKGLDYNAFAEAIDTYAKDVYFLDGDATDEIINHLKSRASTITKHHKPYKNFWDLLQAVKLASVFAKDAGSLIKFEVNPASRELKIGAQSAALGQNHSTINISGDGEDIAIAFNARFLLDALNAFSNGKLVVKFKGPLAPMLIQEPEKPDFRHIIMPIKVEG